MNGLLAKEDQCTIDELFTESDWLDSLDDAIKLMDKYPWHQFVPIEIHPNFFDIMRNKFQKRGREFSSIDIYRLTGEWDETQKYTESE